MNKDFSANSIVRQKLTLLKEDIDQQISDLRDKCDEQITNSIELL